MRKTLILVTAFMMMAYPLGAMGTSAEEEEALYRQMQEKPGVLFATGAGLGAGLTLTAVGVLQVSPEALLTGTGIMIASTFLCAQSFKK